MVPGSRVLGGGCETLLTADPLRAETSRRAIVPVPDGTRSLLKPFHQLDNAKLVGIASQE